MNFSEVKINVTGYNHIGVPNGIIYAPIGTKIEDLIDWRTFSYGISNWDGNIEKSEIFEFNASDLGVYVNDICLAININGFWYSPNELPEN